MSSELQHRLFHFESAPPASVWEGIDAALDEKAPAYANKLHQYQQAPGAAVWDKINAQLEGTAGRSETPVVPLWRSTMARYAAAAAVLVFLAAGITYLVNQKADNQFARQTIAHVHAPNTLTQQTPSSPVTKNPAEQAPTESANQQTALSVQPLTSERKEVRLPRQKPVQYASAIYLPDEEPVAIPEPDVVPQERSLVNAALADRYMIATRADGGAVRLPKKAYSDYACATQQMLSINEACKVKITTLQSRMAAAMTTDFAQFIDLLQNLQEN